MMVSDMGDVSRCVPFAGTKDAGTGSRARKGNGTLSRPVSRPVTSPSLSRLGAADGA